VNVLVKELQNKERGKMVLFIFMLYHIQFIGKHLISVSIHHTHTHKQTQKEHTSTDLCVSAKQSKCCNKTVQYSIYFWMQNTKFMLPQQFNLSVYTINLAQNVVGKNLNPKRFNQL